MYDHVFFCYSRVDEDFVLKLATNLKNHGVPVWLDQWDIPSGVNWPRAIDKALSDCASLLVVLSPSSVESDEVQSEWYAALDEKKVVVPIIYQTCRMPFRLKPIQYIDFTSRSADDEKSLELVLRALGMVEGAPAKPLAQREPEPEKASDWLNKGDALRLHCKYDEAIKAYNTAIELDPKYALAWNNKGIALSHYGKFGEAIKAFNKAIEIDPNYVDAWNNKGLAHGRLVDRKEAFRAFNKAIELNPKYAIAWYNKASILNLKVFLGHDVAVREAIEAYDKAIELDPKCAKFWFFKGLVLKFDGRTAEAEAAFAKAKELGFKEVKGYPSNQEDWYWYM